MANLSTPIGISINEIATNLMVQNRAMSFKDAKKEAKQVIKAAETLRYGGSKIKHSLLTNILGDKWGSKLSHATANKDTMIAAADTVAEHKRKTTRKVESPKEIKQILKKLDTLSADIKTLKATKIATTPVRSSQVVPETNTPGIAPNGLTPKNGANHSLAASLNHHQNIEDAKKGLSSLGYKSAQAYEMLIGAPAGADVGKLIEYALANKDKKKAMAIPAHEVPAAVEAVEQQVKAPSEQSTENHSIAPVSSSTPTENHSIAPAPKENKIIPKEHEAEASSAEKDVSQKKAKETMSVEQYKKYLKKQESTTDKILGDLTDIKKGLKGKSLNQMLAGLLVGLGKGIFSLIGGALGGIARALGPILIRFLGPAIAVIGAGILGYEVGKVAAKGIDKLVSKVTGGKETNLGGLLYWTTHADEAQIDKATAEKNNTPTSEIEAIKQGKASWMDPSNPELFHQVPKDKRIGPTYSNKSSDGKPKVSVVGGPKKKEAVSADRISQANQDKNDMTSDQTNQAPPTVVNNNQTVNQAAPNTSDDTPPIIQLRNSEPSLASYVASIFDHPVTAPGLYMM